MEKIGTIIIAVVMSYMSEMMPTNSGPIELPSRFCVITQKL